MKPGIFYGIGIGPGDPDLITLKGAAILGRVPHVFVPRARITGESLAFAIAGRHITPQAEIHDVVFPMTKDEKELDLRWRQSANAIADVLRMGQDAAFITLGDSLFYSTYIYCIRALRQVMPDAEIITVPGITALSLAAAVAEFPLGEGAAPVTIVPAVDDIEGVRHALRHKGTLVIMKVGERLASVAQLLEEMGALKRSILVSHAGMAGQRIETDMSRMDTMEKTGYLSIILTRNGDH